MTLFDVFIIVCALGVCLLLGDWLSRWYSRITHDND